VTDPVSQARDSVEILAEEFLERRRRGEVPSLKEYADRYPHLAQEIRDVFPALVLMDEIDPQSAELATSLGGLNGLHGQPGLQRLGDFRILRVIGRGGMGIVYEAHQESLGRHVALKVLPPSVSGRAHFRERFQREARAAAQLHHTNIVPIFGVGEDQGVLYFAMQFIRGQALDAVLEDVRRIRGLSATVNLDEMPTGTLHVSEVVQSLISGHFHSVDLIAGDPASPVTAAVANPLFCDTHSDLGTQPEHRYFRSIAWQGVQAAEGLAHAQGILHRDIKPSNLLLDAHGTLWITDFGLAKFEGSVDITQPGEFVGTLRYMPHERLEGKGDARSDIYALGVTLYEMLTLSPPFTGSDRVGLVGQISNQTPTPPTKLAPLLPRDLETIVLKAMAREAASRYPTARELANDLRRFLENRPIKARRSSAVERLLRWGRRNPVVAGLLGAIFLLLVCLTVISTTAAFRLDAERKAVVGAEADGAEQLYLSLVAQANASRFSHRVGQRFETLEAVRKAAKLVRDRHMPAERLDGLRSLAIAALALPDFQALRTLEELPHDFNWACDNLMQRYARRSPDGIISLRNMETNEEIAKLEGGPILRFSPGGRFLFAAEERRFRVWNVSAAIPVVVGEGEVYGFAFHPDDRRLCTGTLDGSLWLYDLQAPGQKPSLLVNLQPRAEELAFDSTGTRLAMVRAGQAQILDTRAGKVSAPFAESHPVEKVGWHPTGNYLALVSSPHEIAVWDLKRMTRMPALIGSQNMGISVAFTPDGDRLISHGWDGMVRLWDWRTGKQLMQKAAVSDLNFSSDGRTLMWDGGPLSLVQLASGREYRSLVRQSNLGTDVDIWKLSFHPEGRLAAVPMSDGIRLFDLETGDELAALPQSNYAVAFQEDGALLTNGDRGLLRWPIQNVAPAEWQVGPPKLLLSRSFIDMASDRTGNVIGQATGNGAILVRSSKDPVFLGPHVDARHIAISPDGIYAVTGNHEGHEGTKVWDTKTQRLLISFPTGRESSGLFSPNGQWLAVRGGHGWQVVKVGTWEKKLEDQWCISLAFSPDSAVVAAVSAQGVIQLLEVASGKELARLEDPNQAFGASIFSPDGARLLISSDNDKAIHVWDLREIRAHLGELGLDWDAPGYPQAGEISSIPLKARVELGNIFVDYRKVIGLGSLRIALNAFDFDAYLERGRAYSSLRQPQDAVKDFSVALAMLPAGHKIHGELLFRRSNSLRILHEEVRANADLQELAKLDLSVPEELKSSAAEQCNNLAWSCVTTALQQRDAPTALMLIEKAIKLNPKGSAHLNTLGVVYYRLGRYSEANVALERSLRETQGQFAAFDQFFLAMCHARQGAVEEGRKCFDQAVQWTLLNKEMIANQPTWSKELKAFQAEAKELLK
jgi:eukaryotic-like serine/threonine-protein kinase